MARDNNKTLTVTHVIVIILIALLLIVVGVVVGTTEKFKWELLVSPVFLSAILLSLGGSLITALVVAFTIEYYSRKKIEKTFKVWNRRVSEAAMNALTGKEIPVEVFNEWIKIFDSANVILRDGTMVFRFTKAADDKVLCNFYNSYYVENVTHANIRYEPRLNFLKSFLPISPPQVTLKKLSIKTENGDIVLNKTEATWKEDENLIMLKESVDIPAKNKYFIEIETEYMVSLPYRTFIAFNEPLIKSKIGLETDIDNLQFGITGNIYWSDKLRANQIGKKHMSVSYMGACFPGQSVGLWIIPG